MASLGTAGDRSKGRESWKQWELAGPPCSIIVGLARLLIDNAANLASGSCSTVDRGPTTLKTETLNSHFNTTTHKYPECKLQI